MSVRILEGDTLALLPTLESESIHSVVTDPPYHLTSIVKRFGSETAAPVKVGKTGAYARASRGFMGQTWDGGDIAFRPETWAEVFRVMKPGAHLVAFGGTPTVHRMACAIEDAGFEIRDRIRFDCSMWTKYGPFLESLNPEQSAALQAMLHDLSGLGELAWEYGSGFPKSHDVSKALDKAAGADREVTREGVKQTGGYGDDWDTNSSSCRERRDTPATATATAWQGWGTALKPAHEPILLARKPLVGTVAQNVLKYGTGALNIDVSRVGYASDADRQTAHNNALGPVERSKTTKQIFDGGRANGGFADTHSAAGRWPADVLHDGSDEVMAAFAAFGDRSSGSRKAGVYGVGRSETVYGERGLAAMPALQGDSGSASRFFYCAKAGKADRAGSKHPTVKPLALMRWLCRLVTPPGGTILDPFAGSGTTLQAADELLFNVIGIEQSAEYVTDIRRRMTLDAGLFAEVSA